MLKGRLEDNKKDFYEKLGFDSSLDGCAMFDDLVEEIRLLLDTKDLKLSEVLEILPSIELEYYHFFYEIGRYKYLDNLQEFVNSRFISRQRIKKSRERYIKVFNTNDPLTVEKSIYKLAKSLNRQDILQKDDVKTFVKK